MFMYKLASAVDWESELRVKIGLLPHAKLSKPFFTRKPLSGDLRLKASKIVRAQANLD